MNLQCFIMCAIPAYRIQVGFYVQVHYRSRLYPLRRMASLTSCRIGAFARSSRGACIAWGDVAHRRLPLHPGVLLEDRPREELTLRM